MTTTTPAAMSKKTFTPAGPEVVNMDKERDWSHNIGMLDWDTTQILFTKHSLIDFLKYVGVTVDPNFQNIAKLPRYAQFGKLSKEEPAGQPEASEGTAAKEEAPADDFRPSRRVRTAPGGQSSGIFEEETTQPTLMFAPSRNGESAPTEKPAAPTAATEDAQDVETPGPSSYRPSRRVRTAPGGKDSLSGWWTDEPPAEDFKPTRKVRDIPGGVDNMNGIFGSSMGSER